MEQNLWLKNEKGRLASNRDGLFQLGTIRLMSSTNPVAGFAGPRGAVFPFNATASNVSA